MATPELLARQFQRELEAKQEAERRLHVRTAAAEDRKYASSTVYAQAFIKQSLETIAAEIDTKIHRITSGWTGENAAAAAYITNCDSKVLALITAKGLLDAVCYGHGIKGDKSRIPYTQVTTFVGRLVKDQLMLDSFAKAMPEAFQGASRNLAHKGYANKVARYRAAMRRVNYEAPHWTPRINHSVGAWLIDRVAHATGWVEIYPWYSGRIYNGPGARTVNCIRLSQEFLKAKDALMEQAEQLAVCRWPMLCEPNDWTDDQKGGYLTAELRRSDRLVRTRRKGPSLVLGETAALESLNNLQRVAYRVNPWVLEIANQCQSQRLSIGKFRAEEPQAPPPKPEWETASDEEKIAYRQARTSIEDWNASVEQRNYRSTECLWVANKYRDDVFWIPWSFDFRGRVYPLVTAGLSPQGTDFDKSLIYFDEEGPVNDWYLAFQVATTAGLDKSTMEERQEWVKSNLDVITAVATEPLSNIELWSEVGEPWCFLAACREYWECVITKTRSSSGLPVGVDATCSGLQHLSAMTYDRSAAQMVNVVPTTKPTDAYALVAEKAKEFLPQEYHPLMNRKVTKRTVMTTPYGVTMDSARGYIREALPKTLPNGDPLELSKVVKAVFKDAIPAVIPGPIRAMEFIQKAAVSALKDGRTFVRWTSPSGFPVVQDDRQTEVVKVETRLLGTRLQSSVAKDDSDLKPSPRQAKKGSAPNLVHSFDAALIHLTFQRYDKPFTVIHDCVLGRSCDMDEIAAAIREQFVAIYTQPVLERWADEIGVDFDHSIMVNTLDINQVTASSYFFC